MKQTAVEWLVEEMLKQGYFDGNKPLTYTNLDHLQQQAKEMEKQQIIDTQSYAISLLKQTTEYEVLDSWKEKVKELEQLINKI
jgi:hypothetical protein